MMTLDMSTETSGVKAEFKYHAYMLQNIGFALRGLETWTEIQLYWNPHNLDLVSVTYVTVIASAIGVLLLSVSTTSAQQSFYWGLLQSAAEGRHSVDPIFNTIWNMSHRSCLHIVERHLYCKQWSRYRHIYSGVSPAEMDLDTIVTSCD